MAFGSWFKNIMNGAKNVISKVAPVVSKVAHTLSPVFGGSIGKVLEGVGNISDKINTASTFLPSTSTQNNNFNATRFSVPKLK